MKLIIIVGTIITIIAFAFGYSLARFNYINSFDKTLSEANSILIFQRDTCYKILDNKLSK